jgi:serine/threonine protein kinase
VTVAFSSRSAAFVSGYRAVAHLERGDLCDVYIAWSEEREARCVVKILRPDRRAFAADRRRVVLEGELLLSLTHPHIVRAYEVQEDPVPFIVLESATGESLERLIEQGPFSTRDLARLATQLCSALGYLHRHGYLHLDLKPANVSYERGNARLVDLSLARRLDRAADQSLSVATDAWHLGRLLYGAAIGRTLPRGDEMGVGSQVLPPPLKKNGRLLPATSSVIMRCLSVAPEDRPSMAEVARVFAPLV